MKQLKQKRILTFGLCAVLVLLCIAFAFGNKNNQEQEQEDTGMLGLSNPWTDYESQEEAEQAVGFPVQLPDIQWTEYPVIYRVMTDTDVSLLEIIYENAEQTVTVRKGTGMEDVSGDFNSYTEQKEVTAEGNTVTLQGNDGSVSLATWTKGNYAYSVQAEPGIDEDTMTALVSETE